MVKSSTAVKTKVAKVEASHVECIINDESKLHECFEVGDCSAQGDFMLFRLPSLPKSAKPRQSRQLAEGTSMGSRHIVERGDIYDCDPEEVCKMITSVRPKIKVDSRYIGPVFVCPDEPTADDLSHPDHGNQGFPGKSIICSISQRILDAEDREMRNKD